MIMDSSIYDAIVLHPVNQRTAKNIAGEISHVIVKRLIWIMSMSGTIESRIEAQAEIDNLMYAMSKVKLVKTGNRPTAWQLYDWMTNECPGHYDTQHAEIILGLFKYGDLSKLPIPAEEMMTRILFVLDKLSKLIAESDEIGLCLINLWDCLPELIVYMK